MSFVIAPRSIRPPKPVVELGRCWLNLRATHLTLKVAFAIALFAFTSARLGAQTSVPEIAQVCGVRVGYDTIETLEWEIGRRTWQIALEMGFRGSVRDWERLLRICLP